MIENHYITTESVTLTYCLPRDAEIGLDGKQ